MMDFTKKHLREKVRAEKTDSYKHRSYPHRDEAKKSFHKNVPDQGRSERINVKEISHNHRKESRDDPPKKKKPSNNNNNLNQRSNSGHNGSDTENRQQQQQHHRHHHTHHYRHHHENREEEESFEELSRRKKMIESELHALDQEEAAAEREKNRKRRSDREMYREHETRNRQHDDHPVRIKQETHSDDENRRKRQRRSGDSRQRRSGSMNRDSAAQHREWGKPGDSKPSKPEKEKEKPNFETSGKLTEDTNMFNGVVIKYNEPTEARKPRRKWRLYPFKGDTALPFIPVHRQSAYLLGRSRLIADIPIDHPSCSKQHAILQFRLMPYERPDGTTGKSVRPYIIDLESANGTFVNNKKVEPRRYVELLEKDVLKFGFSSRVYVMLHEDSKNDETDDDDDAES